MDQAQGLSARERLKQALEKFWRAHIVDDDPYDALENERFEVMIRAAQGKNDRVPSQEIRLAA